MGRIVGEYVCTFEGRDSLEALLAMHVFTPMVKPLLRAGFEVYRFEIGKVCILSTVVIALTEPFLAKPIVYTVNNSDRANSFMVVIERQRISRCTIYNLISS